MHPAGAPPAEFVAGPDSVVWRRASDARVYLTAGYALVMQVAHPTVGSGVRDHSTFETDPWGRLWRTLDYTNSSVYGGAAAAEVGRRLRTAHRGIRGTNPDGTRYHALEPEAFAWVHATLVDAIVTGHARFGRPLGAAETEQLYQEWLALGRLIGVEPGDLPVDWIGFRRYMDAMTTTRLANHETVDRVLASLARPPNPLPARLAPLWPVAAGAAAHLLRLVTVGLLPEVLRERFGLGWSRRQEVELRAVGAALRATSPLLPAVLTTTGPGYLRRRRLAGSE
jgi:uncharacterized protein (DUF2236 family)